MPPDQNSSTCNTFDLSLYVSFKKGNTDEYKKENEEFKVITFITIQILYNSGLLCNVPVFFSFPLVCVFFCSVFSVCLSFPLF